MKVFQPGRIGRQYRPQHFGILMDIAGSIMLPSGFPGRVPQHAADDQRRDSGLAETLPARPPQVMGGGVFERPSGEHRKTDSAS